MIRVTFQGRQQADNMTLLTCGQTRETYRVMPAGGSRWQAERLTEHGAIFVGLPADRRTALDCIEQDARLRYASAVLDRAPSY